MTVIGLIIAIILVLLYPCVTLLTRFKSPLRKVFHIIRFLCVISPSQYRADSEILIAIRCAQYARNEAIHELSFPSLVSLSSYRRCCVKRAPIRTTPHQRGSDEPTRAAGNLRRGIALGRGYGKCESCRLDDVGVADLTHVARVFFIVVMSGLSSRKLGISIGNFMPFHPANNSSRYYSRTWDSIEVVIVSSRVSLTFEYFTSRNSNISSGCQIFCIMLLCDFILLGAILITSTEWALS